MFIYQCYYYTIFYGYIWLFVFNSWLFRDRFLENDKCNLLGPKDSSLHQTNNPLYNMDIKEDPPSSSAVEMVWWWARGASATLICPDVILMQDWGWPRARGRGEKSNVSYRIKFSLGFLAVLRPPARRYTPGSVSAVSITQECRDAESPACCHSDRAAWIQSVTERVNARKREREKERKREMGNQKPHSIFPNSKAPGITGKRQRSQWGPRPPSVAGIRLSRCQ